MNRKLWRIIVPLCALMVFATWASSAYAQSDAKKKPPMYSYVGFWNIPRAQWGDMEKSRAADQKILDKAVADGLLVGYGDDMTVVHEPDGYSHDDWWSSMSMAGILNVLDQFYKAGASTTPVLESATRHGDGIFVTRYYNWHSGSWKGAYSHVSAFKLKSSAPDDALDTLATTLIVPLLDKLLADGTLHEYEIDTEAIHTQSPDMFWIDYIGANAEALDKVDAALGAMMKANPLGGPAFDAWTDYNGHHDFLLHTNATFK